MKSSGVGLITQLGISRTGIMDEGTIMMVLVLYQVATVWFYDQLASGGMIHLIKCSILFAMEFLGPSKIRV